MSDGDNIENTRASFMGGKPVGPESSRPRIVVLLGPEPGRRYTLDGPIVTIGRSEVCDIQIDDSRISRRHIRLRHMEGRWLLDDLESRNGTIVNGERVDAHILELGDRIQLSVHTLLLFTGEDPLGDLVLHRQQMAVIGQLAAGIAHDFNNLLNVIETSTAHLGTLAPTVQLGSRDVVECRRDIVAATARAAELTGRLLSIARRPDAAARQSTQAVDMVALFRDVLRLIERTFDRSVSIATDIAPGLAVDGDPAALHQLLMNLCINARDSMPEGGSLSLRAALAPETAEPRSADRQAANREAIIIEITDTGIGMDAATRSRVFEPFFTTKAKDAGSGLGLATVYEIATHHGGSVSVESELGKGSTFRVRLPSFVVAESPRAQTQARRAATWDGAGQRSTGCILVVDDQELVRRGLGRLLEASGHSVTYASDGEEAIELFQHADPRPDLVLMDLDMPRMGGAEALVRLRSLDSRAKIILISGYYDEPRKHQLLADGAMDFLGKPVDVARLRDSIRLALASG